MAYDFGDGDLQGLSGAVEDIPDPRVSVTNLVDVMLVFALGMMVSLVTYWNLDLPTVTQLNESQMQPLDNAEEIIDAATSSGSYIERGRVYQDPNTGQLYWMEEVEEEGQGQSAGETVSPTNEAEGSASE
jgi:hypothetical protein